MEKTVSVQYEGAAASTPTDVNDSQGAVARVVDCRDELCPKPILMVKKALSEAALGEVLEIVVNEHVSKENVLKYCWNRGQQVVKSYESGPGLPYPPEEVARGQGREADAGRRPVRRALG